MQCIVKSSQYLDDDGQIWREGAGVGLSGLLLVLVWCWKVVKQFGRTLEHVAIIVWFAIHYHVLGCNFFCVVFAVDSADQVTERDSIHAVASGAHLPVHFVATTDSVVVRVPIKKKKTSHNNAELEGAQDVKGA